MTLVSIPANPVPEGATVGTVKTSDGVVLRFAAFYGPDSPQTQDMIRFVRGGFGRLQTLGRLQPF